MYQRFKKTDRVNRKLTPSKFQIKWGQDVHWFAREENVSPAAIQMRVMRFSNPWMRKPEPSACEKLFCCTVTDLAIELNIHPQTVVERIHKHGNPRDSKTGRLGWNRHQQFVDTTWQETTQWGKMRGWLMESCPLYPKWKAGEISWQQVVEELNNGTA